MTHFSDITRGGGGHGGCSGWDIQTQFAICSSVLHLKSTFNAEMPMPGEEAKNLIRESPKFKTVTHINTCVSSW